MKQLLSVHRNNHKNAPRAFYDACRTYSKALKAKKSLENSKNIRKHERAFRNNPWLHAKKCCSGKITRAEPDFSVETAYAYFRDSTTSSHQTYQTFPEWVSQVMPSIDCDDLTEFDLSAITPGIIRNVLKNRPSNSSSGDDEITYHHLKKLPIFSGDFVLKDPTGRSCCPRILVPSQDQTHPQKSRSVQS